jgi:hypothetical protein
MTRLDNDSRYPGLVKIWLPLPESDCHSYGSESLWAEHVQNYEFKIRNSPFYAKDLSFGDTVDVEISPDGVFELRSVVGRGGHSTYRIFLGDGVTLDSPGFLRYWLPLETIGCRYEGATRRLFAVDVPPEADIHEVYGLLVAGEEEPAWGFEEGHCGHPLRSG